MAPRPVPRLHVVTDDAVLAHPDFAETARRVIQAGGGDLALHLRGPHTSGAEVYRMSEELLEAAGASGVLLVVNDRVDVALALDSSPDEAAIGVHLGRRSLSAEVTRGLVGPDTSIGASTHDVTEVARSVTGGVDYLFFGHVFSTPSHAGAPPAGLDRVESAVAKAGGVPVVAIGGIEVSRVAEVSNTGAHGVAVLRGVWDSAEPERAVRDYISALVRAPA